MHKSLDIPARKIFFACLASTMLLVFCLSRSLAQTDQLAQDSIVLSAGQVLLRNGHYEAALQRATQLLNDQPGNISTQSALLSQKANALRRLGRVQEAIDVHLEVLDLREKHFGVNAIEVSKTCQNLGNCWLDLEEADKAFAYLNRTRRIRENLLPPRHDDLASIFNSLAEYYRQKQDFQRAQLLLNKALKIREENYGESHFKVAPLLINLSNITLDQGQFKDAKQILERLLKLLEMVQDQPPDIWAIGYKNMGNCMLGLGDPVKALQMYQLALDVLDDRSDYNAIHADCLVAIGQYYLSMGEPQEAEGYLLRANAFYKQNFAQNIFKIAATQNELGLCYRYQDRLYQAISFHEKAIGHYYNHGKEADSDLPGFYQNLGKCYLQQGNAPTARYFFQKALSIKPVLKEGQNLQIYSLLFIGNSFLDEHHIERALQNFEKAKQRYSALEKPNLVLKQLIYYNLGLAQFLDGTFDDALTNVEQGLTILKELSPNQSKPPLYLYEQAQLLTLKGRIIQKQGVFYKQALNIYQEAEKLTKSIQYNFRNEQSGLYLLADFSALYHGLIETCFNLSQTESSFTELAYQYAEAYKGAQLRRMLFKNRAKSYAGIPDSLVTKEKRLQLERAFQEQRCKRAEQDPFINQKVLSQLYQDLHTIAENQKDLKQQINLQYPAYARLIQQDFLPPLNTIRETLLEHQSMLEYTLTDSLIFTFVISPDTVVLHKQLKPDNFHQTIETFYYLIRVRPDLLPQQLVSAKDFVDLAHQLYQMLILPVKPFLCHELIIIPDDVLCYLPFDALLEKTGPHAQLYANHAYLFHEYAISYCYSASLYQLMFQKKTTSLKNEILAFAPSFKKKLPPLIYNTQEVTSIMSLFRGTQLEKEAASKARFKSEAPNYRFLHLATHSALDSKFPDLSYLAFSESPGLDQNAFTMYMSEVYSLPLEAELVTLSACQTGIGSLRKGESLISMARAFAYAGAKSIVASLWSIDDEQTSILMKLFYQKLIKGYSKSEALRQSKLQYLKQSNHDLAHPYYWAALTAIGDPSPVENIPIRDKWWWIWPVYISLTIIGIVLFLLRKKLSIPTNA